MRKRELLHKTSEKYGCKQPRSRVATAYEQAKTCEALAYDLIRHLFKVLI